MVPAVLVVALLAGCGRIAFDSLTSGDGGTGTDSGDGSVAAPCTTFTPWGNVTHIDAPNAATANPDWEPALRNDGLVLVFQSNRPEGSGLYVTTRASVTDDFGAARELTELYGAGTMDGGVSPMWHPDGSELYYVRYQQFGSGPVEAPFLGGDSFGANIAVDLPYPNVAWDVSDSLLELFYTDTTTGPDVELRHATRATTSDAWIDDALLDNLNTAGAEGWPSFDGERQELYFERDTSILVAQRSGPAQPFGAPTVVPNIGTGGDPEISADGRTLVFADDRINGSMDLFVATRACAD